MLLLEKGKKISLQKRRWRGCFGELMSNKQGAQVALTLFLPGHLITIEINNGVGDLDAAGSGIFTHACCTKIKIEMMRQDLYTKPVNTKHTL
jgi:hypothetical protein